MIAAGYSHRVIFLNALRRSFSSNFVSIVLHRCSAFLFPQFSACHVPAVESSFYVFYINFQRKMILHKSFPPCRLKCTCSIITWWVHMCCCPISVCLIDVSYVYSVVQSVTSRQLLLLCQNSVCPMYVFPLTFLHIFTRFQRRTSHPVILRPVQQAIWAWRPISAPIFRNIINTPPGSPKKFW